MKTEPELKKLAEFVCGSHGHNWQSNGHGYICLDCGAIFILALWLAIEKTGEK